MVAGSWVVIASVASAAGTAALIWLLWDRRAKPGAGWFLASLGFQFLWGLAYGVALLTEAAPLRWLLEVVVWTAMGGLIACFLAFALEYTGRGTVAGWRRVAVLGVPTTVFVVSASNPVHGLAWTGFSLAPIAGLATVSYELQPWALAGATLGVGAATLASLLLFDTVLSYGPLYRGEAIAVGLSTIPPSAALLAWLYGVGPVPALNLTTVFFLPHVALDAYAFGASDMFEFHPATRRTGERAAIQDLGNPVVIVDEWGRVVTLNAAAEDTLGVPKAGVLTDPVSAHLGEASIDPAADETDIELSVDGQRRTYLVRSTPLRDGRDVLVGFTLVFQDVTDARRREQRLAVLNRALRHNLRNDMTVLRGNAAAARDAVEDEAVAGMLETAVATADELAGLGERARDIERVLETDQRPEQITLGPFCEAVLAETDGADRVTSAVPADLTVEADRRTLSLVLGALLENALEHGSPDDGEVRLAAHPDGGGTVISIADDGPGIPENELAVLAAGIETDLAHSTGLGLWLATWGTARLGGALDFETGADGTTVRLSLPS